MRRRLRPGGHAPASEEPSPELEALNACAQRLEALIDHSGRTQDVLESLVDVLKRLDERLAGLE